MSKLKKRIKMKVLFTLALVVGLSCSVIAQVDRTKIPEPGPAPEIQIGDYEMFTLENGLKVIVVENNKLPRVSFSLSLDYVPIFEGEKAGYSSITGQLLNTGTRSRTKAELDEEIDFIGASVSASSSGVYASSLTKHKEKLLDLMTDLLFNPSFPESELEKIKKQTISGLAAYKEDADQIASSVANVIRYGKDHPYGELTRVENIELISVADCKNFYHTYFKPNISYLTIVGDISIEEAKPLVKKYFSDWAKGEVPKPSYDIPQKPENPRVVFVDRPQSVQSIVLVTYPIDLKPGTPDAIPARVMNTILGGGFSSNLNQNLREDHAYTYGAGSSLSSDRLIGRFSASANVRNEVTDSTVYEILYELNRLRDNVVEEEQLQSIKNYLTGSFARSLESPQTVARFALNIERYSLPKDYYSSYLKKLNKVTVEDIQKMALKYLTPEQAYILVVGKKDDVAGPLEKISAIEYLDLYGDPIKEFSTDMDPVEIINNYLDKIGGTEQLRNVSSLKIRAEASFQGMKFMIESIKSLPDKSLSTVSIGGNIMQKRIYNQGEAKIIVQGNSVPVSDKDKLIMKNATAIFPELEYEKNGCILEIVGIKKIGEEEAFEVKVNYPDGTVIHNFYGKETGLKLMSNSESEGEVIYMDYKVTDGVLMPFRTTATTAQGYLEAEVEELELNIPIDEKLFSE